MKATKQGGRRAQCRLPFQFPSTTEHCTWLQSENTQQKNIVTNCVFLCSLNTCNNGAYQRRGHVRGWGESCQSQWKWQKTSHKKKLLPFSWVAYEVSICEHHWWHMIHLLTPQINDLVLFPEEAKISENQRHQTDSHRSRNVWMDHKLLSPSENMPIQNFLSQSWDTACVSPKWSARKGHRK